MISTFENNNINSTVIQNIQTLLTEIKTNTEQNNSLFTEFKTSTDNYFNNIQQKNDVDFNTIFTESKQTQESTLLILENIKNSLNSFEILIKENKNEITSYLNKPQNLPPINIEVTEIIQKIEQFIDSNNNNLTQLNLNLTEFKQFQIEQLNTFQTLIQENKNEIITSLDKPINDNLITDPVLINKIDQIINSNDNNFNELNLNLTEVKEIQQIQQEQLNEFNISFDSVKENLTTLQNNSNEFPQQNLEGITEFKNDLSDIKIKLINIEDKLVELFTKPTDEKTLVENSNLNPSLLTAFSETINTAGDTYNYSIIESLVTELTDFKLKTIELLNSNKLQNIENKNELISEIKNLSFAENFQQMSIALKNLETNIFNQLENIKQIESESVNKSEVTSNLEPVNQLSVESITEPIIIVEAEPKTAPEPNIEAESKTKPVITADTESKTVPEPKIEPVIIVEAESKPAPEPKTEAESKTEPVITADTESKPEIEQKTNETERTVLTDDSELNVMDKAITSIDISEKEILVELFQIIFNFNKKLQTLNSLETINLIWFDIQKIFNLLQNTQDFLLETRIQKQTLNSLAFNNFNNLEQQNNSLQKLTNSNDDFKIEDDELDEQKPQTGLRTFGGKFVPKESDSGLTGFLKRAWFNITATNETETYDERLKSQKTDSNNIKNTSQNISAKQSTINNNVNLQTANLPIAYGNIFENQLKTNTLQNIILSADNVILNSASTNIPELTYETSLNEVIKAEVEKNQNLIPNLPDTQSENLFNTEFLNALKNISNSNSGQNISNNTELITALQNIYNSKSEQNISNNTNTNTSSNEISIDNEKPKSEQISRQEYINTKIKKSKSSIGGFFTRAVTNILATKPEETYKAQLKSGKLAEKYGQQYDKKFGVSEPEVTKAPQILNPQTNRLGFIPTLSQITNSSSIINNSLVTNSLSKNVNAGGAVALSRPNNSITLLANINTATNKIAALLQAYFSHIQLKDELAARESSTLIDEPEKTTDEKSGKINDLLTAIANKKDKPVIVQPPKEGGGGGLGNVLDIVSSIKSASKMFKFGKVAVHAAKAGKIGKVLSLAGKSGRNVR